MCRRLTFNRVIGNTHLDKGEFEDGGVCEAPGAGG